MNNVHPAEKHRGELRQDIISDDWVVIAAGRSQRPDSFTEAKPEPKPLPAYKETCPFCNTIEYPQEPDVLRLPNDPQTWQVHIFGNKYPAFTPHKEFRTWNVGPHRALEAVGYHEILAPRQHNKIESELTRREMALQIEALILRYRQLKVEPSVNYIQIIKNHGPEAGGSVEHPHHQIFTVPVLPNDVAKLFRGAENYAKKNGKEVFSVILDFEREQRSRIVYENEYFTVFCPFASRVPFETWVMPNKPAPFFEEIGPAEQQALADALCEIMGRLYRSLKNPPYNYYIHSAPCDDTGFSCNMAAFKNFRWHIEILPRLSKIAGFELGTGIEINTAIPEESATFLRAQL